MAETEHRSFSTLLSGLEDGALHDELTAEVKRIVTTLRETRAAQGGKPKAKLDIALLFKFDSDHIEVDVETKTVLPKRARNKTILYPTKDGALTPRNPRQVEMFADVNKPREVVTAPTTTTTAAAE